MTRVLILCTGNSARSQMAEALLRRIGRGTIEVHSAGTRLAPVRPEAIAVMREIGIDITAQRSKHVSEFDGQRFDLVITVCDSARESCPTFFGAPRLLHQGFDDPAAFVGDEAARLDLFRQVRDRLRRYLADVAASIEPAT